MKTWIGERIKIAADEDGDLLSRKVGFNCNFVEQFLQFMDQHHWLDQFDITKFRVPMNMGGAYNQLIAGDILSRIINRNPS